MTNTMKYYWIIKDYLILLKKRLENSIQYALIQKVFKDYLEDFFVEYFERSFL